MKTLLITLLLATTFAWSASAGTPTTGFIRESGTYLVDTNGSQIDLSKLKDGILTFSLTRIDGKSRETISLPKFSKHGGWFVFIESPTRIWTFDGGRQLDVLTPSGRYSVAAKEYFDTCPKVVWDALPESARRFLHDKRAD